ncbi:MAG TPA: tetratricopeptide repeat protein [Thermoanaerobaculia bacterium]|nr:tetratricopeptide repeat protein [Thermoanaerobaculia bacterium]
MADSQAERIRDLEQRMAAMPGSRIFVGLAEEYRRAGRLGDALATLRSGLESHPTYLSARIAIARLFQEMGRDDEAIDAFGRVLAADRENLVAAKALGDLYGRRGNAVEAIKKYKLYRALSGDRAVDGKIAALEKDARPEAPVPPPPPPPKAPEARMFDPINFSDSSAEFRFDPNSTISLSTLEFSPAEPAAARTAAPEAAPPSASAEAAPAVPSPPPAVSSPAEDVTLPDVFPFAEPEPVVESTQAIPVFGSGVGEPEPAARETAPATDAEGTTDAPPELPPSRTLAELYERQGFRDEARRIYERLAADNPDDESLTRRIAVVREESSAAGDVRIRRVRALEAWLARVHANAASGTRRA